MTTECFLASAKQLRLIFTTLCFGGILLWIISGRYLDQEQSVVAAAADSAKGDPAELHWGYAGRERGEITELPRSGHFRKLLTAGVVRRDARAVRSGGSSEWLQFYEEYGTIGTSYDPATAPCSDVHRVNKNESKCTYVKIVSSCQNDEGLLNYLNSIYCTMPAKLIPLALVLLFVWLIFLFIFLGATAEEYFCPSLTVISQVLHLSQNVAGVTLLALGNGAPDIFSAFAAISQKDDHKSSLAIGALFGAGIFVTTIVVGAVAFVTPFQLTKRPFLRDIIFYTIAVYWTFYLLWRNTVDIYNASGFIAFYIVYVVVVIVGRAIFQRWKRRNNRDVLAPQSDVARKPTSPTGKELNSSEISHTGTIITAALPTVDTRKPPRSSVPKTGYSISPIIEEEEEENEEKLKDEVEAAGWLHHVVQLSGVSLETGPQAPPGTTVQDAVPNKDNKKGVGPTGGHTFLSTSIQKPAEREELFSGGSAHPLFPQIGVTLLGRSSSRRKGRSVSPSPAMERDWGGMERRIIWDELERPRSASPRKMMRKTLSGALDITEEVGAAIGIPHVPQIWEEVHREHHHHRTSLPISIRSRSRSKGGESETEKEEDEEEGDTEETTPLFQKSPLAKKPHPFVILLKALWPFGEDFRNLGIVGKVYEILKFPCTLLLTITVPVIDHGEELHNWNRWLNILHCITGPMMVALLTKRGLYLIAGVFPIWTLVLILSTILAVIVACTSRNDKPPVYHCAFAWVGFVVSVVWIYCIANEIVNLLQAFGIVVKLSDGILGLTLLAWGNSIGDAVSNMTMARQGFPRMAIGACFGGPLLNMLIGIGVASVYKSIMNRDSGFKFKLYFTQVEFFAALFLMVSLALSLMVITFLRFRLRRPYGIFLIAFYIIFLAVAIVAESRVFTISISGVLSA